MFIDENSKPKEKLKAWYLFTEDFVAGTQHLTNEEIGVYIRLLCWNWNKRCRGIPCDSMTQYRIANCITDTEKKSCDEIIQQFFIQVNNHFQNERQLQEYLYIHKRIEASKLNGKLGGRPKKPSIEPSQNPPTPTTTTTSTTTKTKNTYNALFNTFWDKVGNKVSKGTAEKNYIKLDEEWINKPQDLAIMYNKYFDTVEDKKFAKQPAFWLSARKYEDEEPSNNTERVDMYHLRLKGFKEVIESKTLKSFISTTARANPADVQRAIQEGEFTREEAEKYLDMKGWV